METDIPIIIVEIDYDGYFENLTRQAIAHAAKVKRPFWCKTVVVTAGPYRSVGLQVLRRDPSTAQFDYYSAIRRGFGQLSKQDIEMAGELLLEGIHQIR